MIEDDERFNVLVYNEESGETITQEIIIRNDDSKYSFCYLVTVHLHSNDYQIGQQLPFL